MEPVLRLVSPPMKRQVFAVLGPHFFQISELVVHAAHVCQAK
jgi:hypothetical protein